MLSAAPLTPSRRPTVPAGQQEVIRVVLSMLQEHGMDVVFVGAYTEGSRRFRIVETMSHGPAAAIATGAQGGSLVEEPIVLRDGQVLGRLCCCQASANAAAAERDQRWLRHGARLAARLLDNEQVLRELSAQSLDQ
ncbi:hypothetical protein [Ramlibacter humi]|uniref:GAF domain-containing protein n=1 Tax=Ramlibacter humi TaxID=2530451 RepID=A0A4Z0CAY5_9BURK|nr:hypothetical protein [Ramlibacter humi]TFZ08174.1 hypothetical protein EZ216_03155 [Ramlibacter humi]